VNYMNTHELHYIYVKTLSGKSQNLLKVVKIDINFYPG